MEKWYMVGSIRSIPNPNPRRHRNEEHGAGRAASAREEAGLIMRERRAWSSSSRQRDRRFNELDTPMKKGPSSVDPIEAVSVR